MEQTERESADEGAGTGTGATDAGGDFGTAQAGDLGEPPPVDDVDDVPTELSKEEADRALGDPTTTDTPVDQ